MENRIANGDYDGAIGLLDQQKSAKSISKDEDRRRRAVLLTGKAMSLLADDAQAARAAAAEANRLAPELVPAAATLAEALNKLNDPRKALRTIEYTYKINPHPELAELYVAGRGGDKPEDRLKRAKALAGIRTRTIRKATLPLPGPHLLRASWRGAQACGSCAEILAAQIHPPDPRGY